MSTQSTSVDDLLNETALGSFIYRHKVSLVIAGSLFIIALFGLNFWLRQSEKNDFKNADQIYQFRQTYLTAQTKPQSPQDLNKGSNQDSKEELNLDQAYTAYQKLWTKLDGFSAMGPFSLEFARILIDGNKLNEAQMVLEQSYKSFKSNKWISYLLGLELSVLLEDKGEYQAAINYLEQILNSNLSLLEDKLRVDLGRLYYKNKNTEKAKVNLDYVISNGQDEYLKKLAQALKLKYAL